MKQDEKHAIIKAYMAGAYGSFLAYTQKRIRKVRFACIPETFFCGLTDAATFGGLMSYEQRK